MADEPRDEVEDDEGKVLPLREMMSVISTDPADAMHSALVPPDSSQPEPASGFKVPHATLPVEPPDVEEGPESS